MSCVGSRSRLVQTSLNVAGCLAMFLLSYQEEMCERAAQHIPVPEWHRAGGGVYCKVCGRVYYDHPRAVPHTYLTLLCDGRYVKL